MKQDAEVPFRRTLSLTVGALGVVGDTERLLPRGPAKGVVAAVVEAARAVSRELGARTWPVG